ncbi:MAG: hypothetical protein HQL39_18520 [Alphaproteobacteria bacterium]|nr:hypothetical protein [Alphaproteobacteria bacterium]MBF0375392.1 hypothetical protein [Alphaproteobacteria bacterium]
MPASDPFASFAAGLDTPATSAFTIAPADTDLAETTRALYVGGTGDVIGTLADDDSPVTFAAVPAGSILPVRFKRIGAATTATSIVGLT